MRQTVYYVSVSYGGHRWLYGEDRPDGNHHPTPYLTREAAEAVAVEVRRINPAATVTLTVAARETRHAR